MSNISIFRRESIAEIESMGKDSDLIESSLAWMQRANVAKYSYHFDWLGRPIIQYPQDIVAMQELIWSV